jgi:hypothetical protein
MQSYDMAAGPKYLTLLPNWDHALPPELTGEQVYQYLDVYLQGKGAFPKLSPVTVKKEGEHLMARWDFEGEVATADLIASYGEAGNWRGRYWHTLQAEIQGHSCRAQLSAATLPWYVSGAVTDKKGLRYSTPLVRVEPAALGLTASAAVPDYDGCVEWGGFEDPQLAFLDRHTRSGQARWVPRRSRDAKEGKYAAVLEPGRTVLPPILSTAEVPHRFRCFLKAEKPVEVTVQLAAEQKQFRVGTEWIEAVLDFTPPRGIMGDIAASVTVPAGATVLLDAVSFHPVISGQP